MRYLITGEWNRHTLMRLLMAFFFLYVAALVVTNFLMFFSHMSLSPQSVVEYYRGSEEKFLPPRSYGGLLEITHMHLFAMSILFVTLTHLLLFVDINNSLKLWLSLLLFAAGLGDISAGWLITFVHPIFAYLKIGSFLVMQTAIVMILCFTIGALVSGDKLSYRSKPKNFRNQEGV